MKNVNTEEIEKKTGVNVEEFFKGGDSDSESIIDFNLKGFMAKGISMIAELIPGIENADLSFVGIDGDSKKNELRITLEAKISGTENKYTIQMSADKNDKTPQFKIKFSKDLHHWNVLKIYTETK